MTRIPPQDSSGAALQSEADYLMALRRNESWLRRVLSNRVGDGDAVDDLMQEIGLAISRDDLRPEDPARLPAWLYRTAIRQAYQYRRKLGRFRKLVNAAADYGAPVVIAREPSDPLGWLMGQERQLAVRDAMSQLTETDREILLLKYSENWSYQQLADRMGVSVHTVEHRLLKAKKKLRQLLCAADVDV